LERGVRGLLVVDVSFADGDVSEDRFRLDTLRSPNDDMRNRPALWRCDRRGLTRRRALSLSRSGCEHGKRAKRGRTHHLGEHGAPAVLWHSLWDPWLRAEGPRFQKRFSRARSFQVARIMSPNPTASPTRNPRS